MKTKILSISLAFLIFADFICAQHMIKIDNVSGDLTNLFQTAFNNRNADEDFWIGYSIQVNSGNQFQVGSCFLDDEHNKINLRDIIMNSEKFRNYNSSNDRASNKRKHGKHSWINRGISISDKGADKETAILFLYDKSSKSIYDFEELVICNLSFYVDLGNYPVLWLGEADNKKSLDFLINLYRKSKDNFSKKKLISAIGIHVDQPAATSFLTGIINKDSDKELRKSSVFWLGFQNNKEALITLEKIIYNDSSIEIRKDAVMSLSFIQSPEALDELINIAKRNGESEIRKQAVYGLGNKAVQKVEEALKNIIEDDPDIEIKKHAVYALANTSNNIIPYLIKLAKTHPSLEIRKCAIWSLGNSDDERAVDALIEMAKNN